ncbi:hypothetical protein B0T16DRAFT_418408 [Cercophora newfieldiana]|uniref:Nucleoside 2-deoxyribosyltransferase n=1 Tax=Cercophora newfieldiana TaxID=92897 RepID=A0AA39XVU7_9PEZI|nr:hypothetical protein B0T16DRAFT_418408 [Cercophora newfieldiana]
MPRESQTKPAAGHRPTYKILCISQPRIRVLGSEGRSAPSDVPRTRHPPPPRHRASKHRSQAMEGTSTSRAQIVPAPLRPDLVGKRSVFLAGTTTRTTGPDWREALTNAIAHLPVTIFNPLRVDWDSSWREDVDFPPFHEQVHWELDMQERADVIVVYYGPGTDAPISLLELGLWARSGKAIVACHRDYKKRGNVHIVSQRLGIEFLDADDDFIAPVARRLQALLDESEQRG